MVDRRLGGGGRMSARDPSIRAADPARSAWVAANAGAGKTFTLANRVTRLLLAQTAPEKILCLTYTKAAAAEMQGRLFKQLGEWSMLPDADLAERISEIGADPGGAEQLRQARRLFAKALETPGGLKILTIHAFCQNVLTRFPLEADVPASFDVLDDQTARELTAEARRRVLERAGSGDALRAAALGFLLTQTSETTLNDILDAALSADGRKLERFLERIAARNETISTAIRRAHGADPTRGPHALVTEFCSDLKRGGDTLREIAAWLAGGSAANAKTAEELSRVVAMEPSAEMYATYRKFLLTDKGEPRKKLAVKTLSEARPDLMETLETMQSELCAVEDQRRAAHAAALAEAALVVAEAVRHEYATAKRARGALDYDDLISRTQRLLERSDAAAWVLYKLDGGIQHVLIDEAQDTSPEQWRIVKALTAEFFAGAGMDPGVTRTIFAVGDEKQSIFSFQGADPAQFDRHKTFFRDAATAAEREFAVEPLTQSRRSVPQVLEFVDAVFASDAARVGLTAEGAVLHHEAFRDKDKGRVEVWPTVKPSDDDESDPWDTPVDVTPKHSPAARLARQLALTIKGWIGKVVLPGHAKPVKAGDIMILLPRREPVGTAIIRELKGLGVAVAGADRIKLTDQIAVMDLIALGRFVLLPRDDYNLAALLRSPLCAVSEEELFALAYERKGTLWSELERRKDEAPAFGAAHEFLSGMRGRADFAPPYEFYMHALTGCGMRLKLLKRLGHEANDAIDEFLSLSLAYEAANTPSLEGFLHWIVQGGVEIKRDMERARDEVRVMTVHGAKGLESDIVILPDTTGVPSLSTDRGNLLYTEDGVLFPVSDREAPQTVIAAKQTAKLKMLEEHRRLLYVALTRARDRLIVCGFEGKKGVREGSWYDLARAAAERIGLPIERDGETIHVIGEAGDDIAVQQSSSIKPARETPPWLTTPPPAETPLPRLVRPSDAGDFEEPAASPPGAKRFRRGLLVHAMLARLPDLAPDIRRDTAMKFLTARGLASEESQALTDETLAVLDDPVFAPAFAPGSRAEVGIVADLPELGTCARVNGRLDRLAATDQDVLIVDFKTNRPPPASEGDLSRIYLTQMALYRAAATKIFPAKRIACALVWTEGPSLMPLSDALLDGEIARIRTRLDPGEGRS
jgi:ATP-dependent helicase/nuclease subunit A